MFYRLIEKKRDRWLAAPNCPVTGLLHYIEQKGAMRDAQIEAIKTWLFLKIVGKNCSLLNLVTSGFFNTLNFDEEEISQKCRAYLQAHPEAAALYEYASAKDENGKSTAPKIVETIKKNPESIDYNGCFQKIFYNISYTDYLFSLPMGSGKTYLMAAFIYLELYFAQNEPENPAFSHNFIIFAPSGLKSSVIPSLRTIQKFDPSWIIPEPTASTLKNKLVFEILEQNKTGNKSNQVDNPNVQKITLHGPIKDLFGFVAVTNAEKIISNRTDRVEQRGYDNRLIEKTEEEINELRFYIRQLPGLSVFIDEVHHAATDDKKLRAVVNDWMASDNLNSVIGFSGTPYLPKAEHIELADDLTISSSEISNIVYYYPLVDGIGNFLKKPIVKIADGMEQLQIVEHGLREFFNTYKNTVYPDGTCAKIGIYCGAIETLEQQIYPLAERIASEYDLNPAESILRYHRGNKNYPAPEGADLRFASLDKSISKDRIVLLVQIGKEGWDCRSLTGIILSQEGDCPKNMVLQTSCRCLRQIQKRAPETALIYLNASNAKLLNQQLQQQHHISLQEFQKGNERQPIELNRYDRTAYLKLPHLDFYQLRVQYLTQIITEDMDIKEELNCAVPLLESVLEQDAEMTQSLKISRTAVINEPQGSEPANFNSWLHEIVKQGFHAVPMSKLKEYEESLRAIFNKITHTRDDIRCFDSRYDRIKINGNIRNAFYEKRDFEIKEELVPENVSLLKVDAFTPRIQTTQENRFMPAQDIVKKIIDDDAGYLKIDEPTQKMIDNLIVMGQPDIAEQLKNKFVSYPGKDKTFHYLPYETDSGFEQTFLTEVLHLDNFQKLGLEIYYNGDRDLTEFHINCFKKVRNHWQSVGGYTPDFLIIQRKNGEIYKAIIVETKGELYAHDPHFTDRRNFMETSFIEENNKKFNYKRFEYLYLEDSLSPKERVSKTAEAIKKFFNE